MSPVDNPRPPVPTNLVEAARAAIDAYDLYLKSGGHDLKLRMAFARNMGHLEYYVGKAEQGT